MDCMQYPDKKSTKEAEEDLFQYRKRYGLHAIPYPHYSRRKDCSFQYRKRYGLHAIRRNGPF